MAVIARPKSKPQATRQEIEDKLVKMGYTFKDEPVLIGIRGYYKDSIGKKGQNDIEVWDDAIFFLSTDRFEAFNANTDPSKVNTGLATLVAGEYQFYKGFHHPSSPNGYPALRTYPEGKKLPCIRNGKKDICSLINIHKGGVSSTFSAGCQTIVPDEWKTFIDLVYSQMTKNDVKVITYYLIEGM